MSRIDHIDGITYHGRHGAIGNAFRYSIDYVLLAPEEESRPPRLFARNAGALMSVHDSDHGGPPRAGRGAAWVREVLAARGLSPLAHRIELLAQPRVLGHVFNPVSFWLIRDDAGDLRIVIAEVSNTFGDRHSYLCHHDDFAVIGPQDRLGARKIFHVSPFQDIAGDYTLRFDIDPTRIDILIDFRTPDGEGVIATLTGPRRPLRSRAILAACLRRPLGSRRILALIHWQALKLWWKGARYRPHPAPPADDVTR